MVRFVFTGDLHEDYDFTKQMIDHANNSSIDSMIVLGDLIEGKNIGIKIQENAELKMNENLTPEQITVTNLMNALTHTLGHVDRRILDNSNTVHELADKVESGDINSADLTKAIEDKAEEIDPQLKQDLQPLLPFDPQIIRTFVSDYESITPLMNDAGMEGLQKTLDNYIVPVYDKFNSLWTEFNGTVSVGLGNHDTKQIWDMDKSNVYDNQIVDVNGIKTYFSFASAQDTNDKLSQDLPKELALEELVNIEKFKQEFNVDDNGVRDLISKYMNSPQRNDVPKANSPNTIIPEVIRYVRYGMNNREFDHEVAEYMQANNVDKDAAEYEIIKDDPVYQRLESKAANGEIELFAIHEPTGDHASNHVWNDPNHPMHNQGRSAGNPWSFYSAAIHYLAKQNNIPVLGGHTHHAVVTNRDGYLVMVGSHDIFYDVDFNPQTKKVKKIDVYKKAA